MINIYSYVHIVSFYLSLLALLNFPQKKEEENKKTKIFCYAFHSFVSPLIKASELFLYRELSFIYQDDLFQVFQLVHGFTCIGLLEVIRPYDHRLRDEEVLIQSTAIAGGVSKGNFRSGLLI